MTTPSNRRLAGALALALILCASPALSNHAQYYVLDGFGGVHAGGGAPAIGGTSYFGFDIARDIVYIPGTAGDGILVLDGFGGVHAAGLGTVSPATPYFGFDIAEAITYRSIPPRAAGASGNSVIVLSTASNNYTVIETVTISAPDDGFLWVVGSSSVGCLPNLPSDILLADIMINVDATTEATAISTMGLAAFPECTPAGLFPQTKNQTLSHLFPVGAGAHTVNLLARKVGGASGAAAQIVGRSLTAVFLHLGSTGASSAPAVSAPSQASGSGR